MEPFTQEEVDEICKFIYSVNKVSRFDEGIRNIINKKRLQASLKVGKLLRK